jgi:hypothetical protein
MNSCSDIIVNVAARLNTPPWHSQAFGRDQLRLASARERLADPAISAGPRHIRPGAFAEPKP